MKKLILIIALLSIGVFSNAQPVPSVPKAVNATFVSLFPTATGVKWTKKGVDYQANFKTGTSTVKALFAQNGILIQKEMTIPVGSLPQASKTYIQSHYPGKQVSNASKVTKKGGAVLYKAIVGGKEITFDAGGKYMPTKK